MLIQEHIQTAQYFLDAADRKFAAGDVLPGSEKRWGAAAHAVMAVAQHRSWPFGDHRSLSVNVERLAREGGDASLNSGFSVAEKFHANFYHQFMQDFELERGRPIVRDFVTRMGGLLAG